MDKDVNREEYVRELENRVEGLEKAWAAQKAESLAIARAASDASADGTLVIDRRGNVVDINSAFLKLWGIPADAAERRDARAFWAFISAQSADGIDADFSDGADSADAGDAVKVRDARLKDGRVIELRSLAYRVGADALGRVWNFRDVTEQRKADDRLRSLANYDLLTGLANRVLFRDQLAQMLARAQRKKGVVAALFMDLDHFKSVNDTLGHGAGDVLLQSLAERLKGFLREGDIIARQGGDEIAIGLEDIENPESAATVARRILESFGKPFLLEGSEVYSSTSIGISVFPKDASDADNLLKCADSAMYLAKEQGRANYQFYTQDLTAKAHERLEVESSLRRALANSELVLHYQPQIDMRTGSPVGFEALVRWRHPTEGLLLPGRFIPIAEESGLILQIGEWTLREACAQWRRWHDEGRPPMTVAVNMSAIQFFQKDLIGTVKGIIAETGMDPARLELELTEGAFMKNQDESAATLKKLKDLGLRLAVDDFGTGYSSLSYLKRFPIDTLKIDKSFVSDVCENPGDASIAEAIIALARALNLSVMAEGVETAAQRDFLRSRQCYFAQGFFFSKALPAEQAASYAPRAEAIPEM